MSEEGGGGGMGEKDIAQCFTVVSGTSGRGRGRCLVEWSTGAEKRMAAVGLGACARGGAGASVRCESAWQRRET